jgi:hypothetical protein
MTKKPNQQTSLLTEIANKASNTVTKLVITEGSLKAKYSLKYLSIQLRQNPSIIKTLKPHIL